MSLFSSSSFSDRVVKLLGGGSVINGAYPVQCLDLKSACELLQTGSLKFCPLKPPKIPAGQDSIKVAGF